ncbi:MAG: hypothetical protein RR959_08350 [Erysipelotrichaceae bacterium]
MSKIVIEVMSDWNECEQCGGGSEDGGRIIVNGEVVFEHIPSASCYGNESYYEYDLVRIALEKLGYSLEIKYSSTSNEDYEQGED